MTTIKNNPDPSQRVTSQPTPEAPPAGAANASPADKAVANAATKLKNDQTQLVWAQGVAQGAKNPQAQKYWARYGQDLTISIHEDKNNSARATGDAQQYATSTAHVASLTADLKDLHSRPASNSGGAAITDDEMALAAENAKLKTVGDDINNVLRDIGPEPLVSQPTITRENAPRGGYATGYLQLVARAKSNVGQTQTLLAHAQGAAAKATVPDEKAALNATAAGLGHQLAVDTSNLKHAEVLKKKFDVLNGEVLNPKNAAQVNKANASLKALQKQSDALNKKLYAPDAPVSKTSGPSVDPKLTAAKDNLARDQAELTRRTSYINQGFSDIAAGNVNNQAAKDVAQAFGDFSGKSDSVDRAYAAYQASPTAANLQSLAQTIQPVFLANAYYLTSQRDTVAQDQKAVASFP
jgi:hypothetical protein